MLRYLEIKAALTDMIAQSNPGDKLPDRTKLCRQLDTTRTTLDKAIRELTHQGVLSSRKGSGTYVASKLDSIEPCEGTWGVIVPDISEPIYGTLVSGIENVSQKHNTNVILCNSNGNSLTQQRFIKRLLSSQVSGFIIVPVIENTMQYSLDLYNVLVRSKVPFVFCNRSVDGVSAPVITSNDFYGGYIAARHLIARGYQKIAFISEYKYKTSMDRCQGYLTALLENNIEVNRQLIIMPSSKAMAAQAYQQLSDLIKTDRPDAVFCFNDSVAVHVSEIIRQNGLKVSDDVGIIGYDDTAVCNNLKPTLTSVSYKPYQVGKMAADVLQKLITRQKPHSEFDY